MLSARSIETFPPARRQNKRRNRRPPIRYETDVAHGGRAETQEIKHVHEALRALQVSFHGAVQKKNNPKKIGTGWSDAAQDFTAWAALEDIPPSVGVQHVRACVRAH